MSADTLAGPSTLPAPSKSTLCAQCHNEAAKYTCPRCATKTCSAACVRAHKDGTGCSGMRDPVAYVPLSQYGYAALVNDYTFLEEVGRKVEGWGRAIAKDGIAVRGSGAGAGVRGTSMRGGRGRGRVRAHGQDRKQFLAMQLSIRDVDMDVLPTGMERAKKGQSTWDSRKKTALLTVEFSFQPPPNPISRARATPTTLITNKNDWEQSIRQLISSAFRNMSKAKRDEAVLNWLGLDDDDSIPSSVLCVMKKPREIENLVDPSNSRLLYYKLDWNSKLRITLRHKHFVEYPTILLVDESTFDGVLVDEDGLEEDLRERRTKRRKINPKLAKKAMTGLVGLYGSDSEDEMEEDNALDDLEGYSDNDNHSGRNNAEDVGEQDDDAQALEENALDLPGAPELADMGADDDEALDWGDDEIAEDEAKLASLTAAVQQRFPS